ncbi:MAG TPA: nucleotide disphospho-sugar-binding domain-containing protein [Chitinophaga sp.]|uniref:glycosyltransferase n=1 Tax=Chitinophaga sp. TaxID=1869181 RepID=UPI002DBC282E|nr:nucleotide disphospho-sugar-binding domain-containing protein [Chitinophaga sp.]HEU4552425.1 nucleotide disphospho-sugar-binding domain-containing protein [Chitinophaga sp.]
MAKFAFVVPPLTGHINPTLSVGAELLLRGHEVGWISLEPGLQQKLPPGGQLLLVPPGEPGENGQEPYLNAIRQKNVYGVESIKFLYDDVLVPLNRYMFPGIMECLDAFRPDVVINDHELFAGAMAAVKKGIPYATAVTAPAAVRAMDDLPKVKEWGDQRIVALQQSLGLTATEPIQCSGMLTLVFTSRAFFGDKALPDYYRFVGPVTAHRPASIDFEWERFYHMNHPHKVLVSIGTTFDHAYKKDFFSKVCDALGNEPLTVVVVSDPALFNVWPGNFIVQEKVPQLALLPHLDAVVCHGGHNTVCEALAHQLPLVVIPIAYDQSFVASCVTATESGVRLNFKRFKAAHLKAAVWDVLQDPKYAAAAQQIKASFENAGGTARTAELLENGAKCADVQICKCADDGKG